MLWFVGRSLWAAERYLSAGGFSAQGLHHLPSSAARGEAGVERRGGERG